MQGMCEAAERPRRRSNSQDPEGTASRRLQQRAKDASVCGACEKAFLNFTSND
jgi:hypothetical protein